MNRDKRIITILGICTIMLAIVGGTFAYWMWQSAIEQQTAVTFTVDKSFSCSADGGQDLTSTNIKLQPTKDCTNSEYALQRTIKVTPDIKRDNLTINLDMWLTINSLGESLSDSDFLRYALTTNSSSCTENVISQGNFKGLTSNNKVNLLSGKEYVGKNLPQDTYYLYIWLDAKETDNETQNQTFNFSLGGECTDAPKPEAPVLDPAMIPVTIANDGTVTTVSSDDPNWYNYSNKKWANVVLVKENATDGVENSHARSYYLSNLSNNVEVTEDDILEYYVWIPRYKYRIPNNKYCKDITNVNIVDYPECYGAPYKLLISDEEALKQVTETMFEYDQEYFCSGDDEGSIYCTEEDKEIFKQNHPNLLESLKKDGYYETEMFGEPVTISIDELLPNNGTYTGTLISDKLIIGDPTLIDIIFEKQNENMTLGNAMSEYRSHPGFWDDTNNNSIIDAGEMLAGIWFAKFEDGMIYIEKTSEELEELSCYVHVKPNIPAYSHGISQCLHYSTNSTGINSSNTRYITPKNSHWGAVMYLSHSSLGIGTAMNGGYCYFDEDHYFEPLTGCGGNHGNDTVIQYGNGTDTYLQSTTGNISGIFDMSGGLGDVVALDNNITLETYLEESEEIGEFRVIEIKCSDKLCYGYAMYETKGWYNTDVGFDEEIYYRYNRDSFSLYNDVADGSTDRQMMIVK